MSPALRRFPLLTALLILAAALVAGWLALTPPGLTGKFHAVGYAVCHQIESRTFTFGGRFLPLCARCSGFYLGSLAGGIFLFSRGRRGGLPPRRLWPLLMALVAAYALDGLNSLLSLPADLPHLYPPSNPLRLFTGLGMSLTVAALVTAVFNMAAWADCDDQPALRGWGDVGRLALILGAIAALTLSGWDALLYPLALLSALAVPSFLTLLHAALWIIVFKQEGRQRRFVQLAPFLAAGFISALLQIALMDWARLALTGTWAAIG